MRKFLWAAFIDVGFNYLETMTWQKLRFLLYPTKKFDARFANKKFRLTRDAKNRRRKEGCFNQEVRWLHTRFLIFPLCPEKIFKKFQNGDETFFHRLLFRFNAMNFERKSILMSSISGVNKCFVLSTMYYCTHCGIWICFQSWRPGGAQ